MDKSIQLSVKPQTTAIPSRPTAMPMNNRLPKSSTSTSFCKFPNLTSRIHEKNSAAVRSSGYGQNQSTTPNRAKTPSDGFAGML